ncbi:Organic cation/carnitine transporter 3 [Dichanthelium oligosanthes]|uniref:H(+)/Pi cotransporter n=1 Tax=Dichanthelium oligosanthes TaxID=888268 RepID=A0A1E5VPP8_9POAL|nr:Organic cation/carnitine transporter 3 [Dichanthelium oligosanthes]
MVGTCTLVLSTELVGKRWRDTVSVAGFSFFTVGFLSLPALGYTFREESWRNMYLWTSVPSLCYSVLVHFLAQESPRWLLVRGRKQDAIETLQQIASPNGNSITSSFSMLHACTMHVEDDGATGGAGGAFATIRTMWERPWALRRLAAIMTTSFGVGMVYYGMQLNVGSLGTNLYLSVTYNALAELPSAILSLAFIGRINRRSTIVALTASAGAFSLMCVAIPEGSAARMAAELLSFFATVTAFILILIYSVELFPTSVRNSVVVPVLVALGRKRSFWSFGVFGLCIGCLGLFAACLPETRGRSMSDTMEEEEDKEKEEAAAAAVASCTSAADIATKDNSDVV